VSTDPIVLRNDLGWTLFRVYRRIMESAGEPFQVATAIGVLAGVAHGPADQPVVVCWPSLFCDGRTFAPQVSALASDHRVLVLDGIGHGKSGAPTRRFTLDDCAQAVLRVLDHLELGRASLLGCAWGGHVAVATALLAPARIQKLVLMNAPMNAWTGAHRRKLWLLYQLFRWLGPRAFLVELIVNAQLSPDVRAGHPEHAEVIADCVRSSAHHGLTLAIRCAMLERPSLEPQLSAIQIPTLFIAGDSDSIYPVALARAHAEALHAQLAIIASSAHQSGLERSDEVNQLIRTFLDGA